MGLLNDIFSNIDYDVKSYDICDGIYELIEKFDEGYAVGLPYNNMDIITKETGGQYLGSITWLGLSNVGKSTFARNAVIPTAIKEKERIVIIVNEDGLGKWQRELLVFVANNIIKDDLQKHVVRDGHFEKGTKEILYKAADWLKNKQTIISLQFFHSNNIKQKMR